MMMRLGFMLMIFLELIEKVLAICPSTPFTRPKSIRAYGPLRSCETFPIDSTRAPHGSRYAAEATYLVQIPA
jgi:hypothetical protein